MNMNTKASGKLCAIVVSAVAFLPASSWGGIAGTSHDFSSRSWNPTGELCRPCHTPHNADNSSLTDVPLWNHETTSSTFTLYSSSTFDGVSTAGQPTGASLACLSCHDGSVALDSFDGNTGTDYISFGDERIGTDLSNDHPIAFDYTAALAAADGELFDPETTSSGLGDTIQNDLLFSDSMECASCHDVHNDTNFPFLRIPVSNSQLCLLCHDK